MIFGGTERADGILVGGGGAKEGHFMRKILGGREEEMSRKGLGQVRNEVLCMAGSGQKKRVTGPRIAGGPLVCSQARCSRRFVFFSLWPVPTKW